MNNISFYIREFSQRENFISALLRMIYYLFKASFFKAIFPFGMSVLITATYRSIPQVAGKIQIPGIILIEGAFFIVGQILIWWADSYSQSFRSSYGFMKESVEKMTLHLNSWGNKMVDANKKLSTDKTIQKLKEVYPDVSDLQKRSSYLCKNIFDMIKNEYKIENHQVSVMIRGIKRKREYIKMIAFSNRTNSHPGSMDQYYYLDDPHNFNLYHVQIVKEGSNHIRILKNKKEVEKELKTNPKSKSREAKIQQYFCFPITCEDEGIIALLQIDVDKKIWGTSEKHIEYVFQTTLTPFAEMLRLWYHKYHFSKLITSLSEVV